MVITMDGMERIRTYVQGLDERLEGGIPKGHVVLICGCAGSMKSSFVFNILWHMARENKGKCLYITLEEKRPLIERRMQKIGRNIKEVEENLTIIDLGYLRKEIADAGLGEMDWIKSLEAQIKNFHDLMGFNVVALDSLNALYAIANMKNPRDDLFHFFELMRDLNMTAFLISEMEPDRMKFGLYGIEDFLADGIIHLDLRRSDMNVNLYVSVIKMRETKHERKYFPLIIGRDNKFEIVIK